MERTPKAAATSAFRSRLLSWLSEAGIIGEAEQAESALLSAELGSWDERQRANNSWKIERPPSSPGRSDTSSCLDMT